MRSTAMAVLVASTLLFPIAVAGRARAVQTCPASALQVLWSAGEVQSAATTFQQDYTPDGYPTIARAYYDLRSGALALDRTVSGVSWTYVRTHDLYDVTGVAAGTPVALTADLDVDGTLQSPGCGGSGCGGHLGARIYQGSAVIQDEITFPNTFVGGAVNLHETLQMPLVITAGTPTDLEFELWMLIPAGGNAGGSGSGQIRFSGLPTGAQIVSCQGFVDAATPARKSTWGALKTSYR
jgi:hypothetical protein